MSTPLGPTRVQARHDALFFVLATLLAGAYLAAFVLRGFLPQDDGYHAQIAERILDGQLPHVDFHDGYVGGLGFLNALGFELLGASFATLRMTQFAVFVLSIPLVYWLSRRFLSPLASFFMTLLCAVWTLPNFPVTSANWHALTFWLFGTAGLVEFLRTQDRRWLLFAGFLSGIGLLIKITFLFFALAASLALGFHEQEHAPRRAVVEPSRLFLAAKAAALVGILVLLQLLLGRSGGLAETVFFGAPLLLPCALILSSERQCGGSLGQRMAALLRLLAPFWIGFLLPMCVFVAGYAATGHAYELFHDIAATGSVHLRFAGRPLPLVEVFFVGGSLIAWLLLARLGATAKSVRHLSWGVTALALAALVAAAYDPIYRSTWSTLRALVPAATVGTCLSLMKPGWIGDPTKRTLLFALVVVMQFASLVQVPLAIPVYLLFMIPFLFLVLAALLSCRSIASDWIVVPPMVVLILWAAVWANRGNFWMQGFQFQASPFVASLEVEKSGLTVSESQKSFYGLLIPFIQEHAHGAYILAFPDSPEIYFLSGKQNPTKLLFDFIEEPPSAASVADLVARKGIDLVILRLNPEFSLNYASQDIADYLGRHFPKKLRIGTYLVYYDGA